MKIYITIPFPLCHLHVIYLCAGVYTIIVYTDAANRTDEEHYYPERQDGDQGDETVSHDSVMVEHKNPSYIALEKLQTFQQHTPLPEYQNVNLAPRHIGD